MRNFLGNKWFIIILIIVIFATAIVLVYRIIDLNTKLQEQNYATELQNQCAIRSQNTFDEIQRQNNSINYTYKSRYDSKLGKCYVALRGTAIAELGTSDIIIDVYANKEVVRCESYATAPDLDFCAFDGQKSKYNIDAFNYFAKLYTETE